MTAQDRPPTARDRPRGDGEADLNDLAAAPGGLLDLLRVAAVVLDSDGRIALWSPEAEQLLGYRASEALGRNAARLLVDPENRRSAVELFARVRAGKMWAGVFPVRHKDGTALLVEFRTMGLRYSRGDAYALGLAADEGTVRQLETDLAVSGFLVEQSPVGLAVFDTDLRWTLANPALLEMNGLS
jgi:PAS domain S-box-containing protein